MNKFQGSINKIIKAFKHFERDKEKLVAMQNEASLLIQNVKITEDHMWYFKGEKE